MNIITLNNKYFDLDVTDIIMYIIDYCPFHNYCTQLWNVINDINPHTQPLMYIATNKYHYFYSEHFQLSVKLMSSVTQEIAVL